MDVSTTPTAAAQSTPKTTELQRSQARERAQRPPELEQAPSPQPKPVVNTQGQTTGRLVNVTA